jgi:DNA-binding Lrp family transcriptional regulator
MFEAAWRRSLRSVFVAVDVADEQALTEAILSTIQGIPGVRTTETHVIAPV